MAQHNELGKWGEEKAVGLLKSKGYVINETNWRVGHKDIDIIATTPDRITLVFVEVKTRAGDALTRPEDAVDRKKIRNIAAAANQYVKMHDIDSELRFDIITVVSTGDESLKIEHIEDAFNPLLVF